MARRRTGIEHMMHFLEGQDHGFRGLPIREQMLLLYRIQLSQLSEFKAELQVPDFMPPFFFRLHPPERSLVTQSIFLGAHLSNAGGKRGGDIFTFNERFTRHLQETCINLPCELLPPMPGYSCAIDLPYDLEAPDGAFHRSAIISVLPGGPNDPLWDRTLLITLFDFDEKGGYGGIDTQVTVRLIRGRSLEEMIDECDERHPGEALCEWLPCNRPVVNLLAKCLLYIHTDEPDLTPVAVEACLSQKAKKLRRHAEEYCPLPLISVGYGFHGRNWHATSAAVRGHFRWQPFGEGRSKVKLIWIDEHERHYGAKTAELRSSVLTNNVSASLPFGCHKPTTVQTDASAAGHE